MPGTALTLVEAIQQSELSIYDVIGTDDPQLWIPTPELEFLLDSSLRGISLEGLPIRTRSKAVKAHICQTLGYPVPVNFRKTQPRFPGQNFDVYTQKSNNLQIWNEEIVPVRRYVIVRVNSYHLITKVRVVTGNSLMQWDTTGTLTQKYQAQLIVKALQMELITDQDTDFLRPLVRDHMDPDIMARPTDAPQVARLLSISQIFERLKVLVGKSFRDTGYDQERNRGAALHRLVCQHLGYRSYHDDGQFPDIKHQLLEVKLQTSPTIDLGRVCPDSKEALDVQKIGGRQFRHCDVRYALFHATMGNLNVTITHLFLTSGEKFFTRFPRFEGKVLNRKLQIPLPSDFFDD